MAARRSTGSDQHMRLVVALSVCLVATAISSRAQERVSPDGFSICASDLGHCEALTDPALRSHRLSSEEVSIVATLKRYAVAPDDALLKDLETSFAPLRLIASTGKYSDYWLPARQDKDNSQSNCFVCGIHFVYSENNLQQMNYTVVGKFSVIWNRVLVSTSSPR
jgi:hypothetical protein